jgi:hypothetical protein
MSRTEKKLQNIEAWRPGRRPLRRPDSKVLAATVRITAIAVATVWRARFRATDATTALLGIPEGTVFEAIVAAEGARGGPNYSVHARGAPATGGPIDIVTDATNARAATNKEAAAIIIREGIAHSLRRALRTARLLCPCGHTLVWVTHLAAAISIDHYATVWNPIATVNQASGQALALNADLAPIAAADTIREQRPRPGVNDRVTDLAAVRGIGVALANRAIINATRTRGARPGRRRDFFLAGLTGVSWVQGAS